MEQSIDCCPTKRLRTTYEQNSCSTFECLSDELIFDIFEYFNMKEIFQSFSNLNSFITSCIFDRRQQLHLHLDHEMPFLLGNDLSNHVTSLYIDRIIIPIGAFLNLKSLTIVDGNECEDQCLNMINEISKLSQLISFTLYLVSHKPKLIGNEMIKTAFDHSSLQRINLITNARSNCFSRGRNLDGNLTFRLVKMDCMTSDFHGVKIDHGCYKLHSRHYLPLRRQYHIRRLDLDFKQWRLHLLVEFLSAMPSLIALTIKGFCCCNNIYFWIYVDRWDQMLQNLKALQRVAIEIYLALPIRTNISGSFSNKHLIKI
ncbi:unnamed protein product [Rotaria magnacalcarata]|uniref:F-box domain-containing protein n=2 Tax=Rotaria magnacalcarata TaxID=392030 RepID=A0A820ANB5_9BILA|nr:unnamed protein product [Rotaria magnacalcarata]